MSISKHHNHNIEFSIWYTQKSSHKKLDPNVHCIYHSYSIFRVEFDNSGVLLVQRDEYVTSYTTRGELWSFEKYWLKKNQSLKMLVKKQLNVAEKGNGWKINKKKIK